MATTIATLTASIKTKLEGVDGLKAVYDYAIDLTAGYPFATIREAGWSGVFSDTQRNRRTFTFDIYLFQEYGETSKSQSVASRILRELQDEVITAFDSDPTLSGAVDLVQPVRGTPVDVNDRPDKVLGVIVTVECIKLISR